MRAQIRGLAQASENVQDASSLVQVAEGGMKEINDILQRIRELSVQASNDTLTNKDRVFVQEEIDEMKKSIGSIVHNTEFNTHKVLSNRKFDEFIKERRHASNTVEMMNTRNYSYVNISQNIERTNQLDYKSESVISSSISSVPNSSTSLAHLEKGTTVMDYQPRYSLDNDSIIFRSSRDGSAYVVPIDGSQEPQVNTSETTSAIRITSSDGLAKLDNQNTSLYLYTRDSTSDNWGGSPIKSYSYNYYQDSTNGYTFSPNTDSDGNTSFVYSDTNGNVQKVNINTKTKQEISSVNLITNNDIENLPLNNNVINLRNTPDLYHMNTPQASLIVEKVTDLGVNELHYWDQSGDEPADRNEDGVYVNETTNKIELYGSWRPANDETVRVEYLTDYTKDAAYNRYVASGIDTYNLEDEDLFKERSLRVYVGGNEIEYSNTDGYTYDQNSGYISIHGIARQINHQTRK
ncbi:flagellin protein FlaA [Gracilibacillus boraciitolerans JCM 21714]|uniref:Flagellin n=1 Tax=Gracilibacillus boraciitolerans JCM 21714 TaxID=1298598 RepID=W4VN85_9BACI|nr:flagellin protein FlaA [Gracilibacillus boraciitolerans JCM 21714]